MDHFPGLLFKAAFTLAIAGTLGACSKPAEPPAPVAPASPEPTAMAPAMSPDMTASMPMVMSTDNVSDADVTTNVTTALLRDPSLKAFDIAVVTLKGDVRLIGTVAKRAQADSAIALTRAAHGVHSVHDELVVKL